MIKNRLLALAFLPLASVLSSCEPSTRAAYISDDWTFVNYWAEWCKPCIKEIPELNALHRREGVQVLGVNFDDARGDELQRQLDTLGVDFPTLDADPAGDLGTERPQVLPTTLVLAPGGELKGILVGPQTEASLLDAAGLRSEG